jgi:hypothetical protein
MLGEMLSSPTAMKRRLGEARDFLGFLRSRENRPSQQ